MASVRFYPLDAVETSRLKYAVVLASSEEQWVLCRHKARTTWECPGGHIEAGENPVRAAQRELYEETGATANQLIPLCIYSVSFENEPETFGLLCRAYISSVGVLPANSEMACARCFSSLPPCSEWTYPDIQPLLIAHAESLGYSTHRRL